MLRLFLSSTFRDTQAERDILARLVFPRLRAALAAQNAILQEIDLRWGVTAAMSRDAGAVAVCLRELDGCVPLVLGIVTRRVGWRPPAEALARCAPAFARSVPAGAGVTEIELRYALHLLGARPGAAFPVMVRGDRLSRALSADTDEWQESESLRRWALATPGLHAVEYDSLEEFEHRAEEALRPLLRTAAAEGGAAHTPRALAEIARTSDLRSLEWATWWRKPVLAHGPRGAGLSWLVRRWVRNDPHGLYIDGGAVSAAQLAEALSDVSADSWPASERLASALMSRFKGGPGAPRTQRVALDHFERSFAAEARADLGWVPTRLPRGCRLILVTPSERLRDAAAGLGWHVHRVDTVARSEAIQFARAYLEAFGKHLTPAQLSRLGSAGWIADLRSLVLVLDELRRFGSHELLDRRLDQLVACVSGPDVAEEVVAGLRSVLPPPWARAAHHALVAMRMSLRGLQEDEIRATCGALADAPAPAGALPPHLWSAIRVALESGLAVRGPLVDVASGPLLDWADRRFLDDAGEVRRVASALNSALREAAPARRWTEAPRLAEASDPQHGLERLLADPHTVLALLDVGASFCGGWLDRLPAEARLRVTQGWADRMASSAPADDCRRLALLAARSGAIDAARRLAARADAGAPAPAAGGVSRDEALLALLVDDREQLRHLARAVLGKSRGTAGAGADPTGMLVVLAACSDGRIVLAPDEERALIEGLSLLTRRLGDPLLEGQLRLYAGQLAVARGAWREAAAAFGSAEKAARGIGHLRQLCRALERQSAVALERHKFRAARRAAAECRELARKGGLAELEALGFERQIEVERRRANWKEAYVLAESYLARCREGLADQRRALDCLAQLEMPH